MHPTPPNKPWIPEGAAWRQPVERSTVCLMWREGEGWVTACGSRVNAPTMDARPSAHRCNGCRVAMWRAKEPA